MSSGITKSALAKVGVELIDRGVLRLGCMTCGHQWAIRQGADVRRPDHFRVCRVCHPEIVGRSGKPFNGPFGVLRQFGRAA